MTKRENFFEALNADVICHHKIGVNFTSQYHYHDGFEIYLFLEGDANYYIGQNCYHLKRGSLFNIRPSELHRVECFNLKVYERISINIRTSLLNEFSTEQTDLSRCFFDRPFGESNLIILNECQINELILLVHKLEYLIDSSIYGYDIMARSYLYQILVTVNNLFHKQTQIPTMNIMPPIVNKTMQYIDEHLAEPICMGDLSEHIHHNSTYISRCFKNVTGVPLQQYIIYKRIVLAKKYLANGYSLNDTCRLSGFNDYSNFARTLKKQIGCSPKKYQKHPF
jgi:YesN/AraC family two-component response regulator